MAASQLAWAPSDARPIEVPASRYIPELEGLRGLAMLLVLASHTNGLLLLLQLVPARPTPSLAYALVSDGGDLGVDLFFVLSSFLLVLPFVGAARGNPQPSLRRYALRRVLRILPLFYTAVVIATVFNARQPADLWRGVPYLVFLNAIPGFTRPLYPFSGVWWSLATEVEFYIALGLAVWLCRWRVGRMLAVPLLLLWAITYGTWLTGRWTAPGAQWFVGFSLIGRAPFFLAGWMAALCYVRGGTVRPAGARRWMFDGAVLIVVLAITVLARWAVALGVASQFPPWHGYHVLEAILCGALVWLVAATPNHAQDLLRSRLMVWLGVLSYSIYVWHGPILGAAGSLGLDLGLPSAGRTWDALLIVAGAWAVCLGISAVSYRLVERPFLRRKARLVAG